LEGKMKLSDTIKKVIPLAEAIHAYWERELPKRYRDYPFVHEGETDGPPPPETKKLKSVLARLPDEAIYQLALVMYIGRGVFHADNLVRDYTETKARWETAQEAIALLMDQFILADYLTEGMDELKKSGFDVDNLPISTVGSTSKNGQKRGVAQSSRPTK
jgi:hypothetical protein